MVSYETLKRFVALIRNCGRGGTIVPNHHPRYSLDLTNDLRRGIEGFARGIFRNEKLIIHRFRLIDIQKPFDTTPRNRRDTQKALLFHSNAIGLLGIDHVQCLWTDRLFNSTIITS